MRVIWLSNMPDGLVINVLGLLTQAVWGSNSSLSFGSIFRNFSPPVGLTWLGNDYTAIHCWLTDQTTANGRIVLICRGWTNDVGDSLYLWVESLGQRSDYVCIMYTHTYVIHIYILLRYIFISKEIFVSSGIRKAERGWHTNVCWHHWPICK